MMYFVNQSGRTYGHSKGRTQAGDERDTVGAIKKEVF